MFRYFVIFTSCLYAIRVLGDMLSTWSREGRSAARCLVFSITFWVAVLKVEGSEVRDAERKKVEGLFLPLQFVCAYSIFLTVSSDSSA